MQQLSKLLVFLLLASLGHKGLAQTAAAQKMLDTMQARCNNFKDLSINYEIAIPGKTGANLPCSTKSKGNNYLVTYKNQTGDGFNSVLQEGLNNVYVLMDGFGNKVRTIGTQQLAVLYIAPSALLMDLKLTGWLGHYKADSLSQQGNASPKLYISLKNAITSEPLYQRLVMVVDKTLGLPTEISCYDATGKLLKTIAYANYVKSGNLYIAKTWEVKTPNAAAATCRFTVKDFTVNSGLSDDIFSRRALERGL